MVCGNHSAGIHERHLTAHKLENAIGQGHLHRFFVDGSGMAVAGAHVYSYVASDYGKNRQNTRLTSTNAPATIGGETASSISTIAEVLSVQECQEMSLGTHITAAAPRLSKSARDITITSSSCRQNRREFSEAGNKTSSSTRTTARSVPPLVAFFPPYVILFLQRAFSHFFWQRSRTTRRG